MNKCTLGRAEESIAKYYLEEQGYEVLAMNYRCRFGEIDCVARDGEYLVFVEVKYRRDHRAGSPLEAVDARKQKRICRTSDYYRMEHCQEMDVACRYDVIGITGGEITLIKNAFDYS